MSEHDSRTDEELVADANRGDAEAFEALYTRYREWVVGLAWRFTGHREDALDVLQETFFYFFGKFPGFRLTARLKTFLYPAVRNLSIRKREQSKRHAELDEAEGVAASAGANGARSDLAELLGSLDEIHREVLLLRFVDGLDLREISQALEIPLGTVKSRLHNALEQLRNDPRTRNYFDL